MKTWPLANKFITVPTNVRSTPRTTACAILIRPAVKERPRFNPRIKADGKRANPYTPPATRAFERDVAWLLQAAHFKPTKLPCKLEVWTFAPNPRGDATNYLKAFEDAANTILYDDDHQLTDTAAHRRNSKETWLAFAITYATNEEQTRSAKLCFGSSSFLDTDIAPDPAFPF